MNDIVSIRKIRPFPSPLLGGEAGGDPGAALPCGGDFFLAGNRPSLTANEFLTTGGTLRLRSGQAPEHRGVCGELRRESRAPRANRHYKQPAIAYDMKFSALVTLGAECCPSSSFIATATTCPSAPMFFAPKNTSAFMNSCSPPELRCLPILSFPIQQPTRTCCLCILRNTSRN